MYGLWVRPILLTPWLYLFIFYIYYYYYLDNNKCKLSIKVIQTGVLAALFPQSLESGQHLNFDVVKMIPWICFHL